MTTTAHAATAQWTCAASAARATVAGQDPVDPIKTDRTPCAASSTGLPNTTEALGLAPAITARTAYALSTAQPVGARPIETAIGSAAGVEGLAINQGNGSIVIGVDAARSEAAAACKDGAPVLTGSSKVTGLTINGQVITLDGPLTQITDAISGSPLGALITVKLNEQTKDANGLMQRAAHIIVLSAAGDTPLADIVVAESRVSSSSACDPNADGNKDTSGTSGAGSSLNDLPRVCPAGSTLDAVRGVCIITADKTAGQGVITVGPPYSGPSGGTVVALNVARQRYKSPCLSGDGPKFVVVGTQKRDRITGTNRRDRILGLGGNDSLDGGRAVDCVDGGSGNDRANGGIGSDRLYGAAGRDTLLGGNDNDRIHGGTGNDHLNGGPGADWQWAESGNDTINAGFGADRVFAGTGNDAINVATQGPRARVSCGSGLDKVRLNKKERLLTFGCETQYVFADR